MRTWENPFICLTFRAFWLWIQWLSDRSRATREIYEALDGRR